MPKLADARWGTPIDPDGRPISHLDLASIVAWWNPTDDAETTANALTAARLLDYPSIEAARVGLHHRQRI